MLILSHVFDFFPHEFACLGRRRFTLGRVLACSIAERIVELNGKPDFNPETLTGRSLSQYTNARTLYEMIKEDLVAERIAVESYSEVVRWLGERDVTSRKLMADILMVEERHAADMQRLLGKLHAA